MNARARPLILALDASLSATGYARGHAGAPLAIRPSGAPLDLLGGDRTAETIIGVLTPPKAASKGTDRLQWIRDQVLRLAEGCELVVIEGYSFASRGRAIISLGELGGVLRLSLSEAGLPVVEIAPTARAKYATGKGNAGKDEVLAAAIRRLGYGGHSNDEADAAWLFAMASDVCGYPLAELPKMHRAALEAVHWPAPAGLAAA